MYGIRTIGKNLREEFAGAVRQKGLVEGQKEFRRNVSCFNKKHGGNWFSLKGLAEATMGENWPDRLKAGSAQLMHGAGLLEGSVAAVDVSAFSNITGQLLIDRIRDNYEAPQFIGDRLMEIAPVVGGNLGTHREPWLSRVKDDPGLLNPQQEYPETVFAEQYIDLPAVEKRGLRCSVSLEMITADKTKQAMARAEDVGFRLRYNREERQLKVVSGIVNNFKYMGTGYNTYNTSGLWINKQSGVVITDYRGIATAELLFSNMTDLVTGKAILIDPSKMMILCIPSKLPELKIALHAARTRSGQYPTSGAATNALADYEGVPLINDVDYPIVASVILNHLLTDTVASGGQAITATNAKEYIFMGNFQKAFVYREVMPFTTAQAPPGNPFEFLQDVVVQVKAMEWGVAGVQGPQQIVWTYNA
jgi:hypothetical protein